MTERETVEAKVTASTIERILAATGVLAAGGASAFVWYFNPSTQGIFPVCPLFKLTGLACPGCGLTRGFHALFHGDFLTALDFNAMLPVYAVFFGYLLLAMILIAVRGRGISFNFLHPAIITGFLIISFGFAVLRNLPFYPFTILYP
jgi:hypothetical protein